MSKRNCLLTGYETNCTDGCYQCGCGGEDNYLTEPPEKADVQPVRRGKWICTNNYEILAYGTLHYSRCSVCGEESLEEGSFCPNCGAEMRGEDDA